MTILQTKTLEKTDLNKKSLQFKPKLILKQVRIRNTLKN